MNKDEEIRHRLALIRQYRQAIIDNERRVYQLGYKGLT